MKSTILVLLLLVSHFHAQFGYFLDMNSGKQAIFILYSYNLLTTSLCDLELDGLE